MGDFAPYEQVEQLDLAGLVWTARKGPDSPVQYVLKFCAPPGDRLRASAEFQKKLSQTASSLWAPIHHVGGHAGGGAFYVTDQYKWSAQLVFDQKDRFTSEGLARLCLGVTASILQVTATHKRGHGNLKRSNLLLTDRNLDRAAVLLADPSPPDAAELADIHGDRRALGRIIFELVTGLEFKDFFYPVRSQKKWEALGPEAPKWLDWCNRLLAPPNDPTACTIEQFAKDLKTLGVSTGVPSDKKGVNVKLIGAAAAGVVVLAGVGFLVLHGKKPAESAQQVAQMPTPTPPPPPSTPPPVIITTPADPTPPAPTPVPAPTTPAPAPVVVIAPKPTPLVPPPAPAPVPVEPDPRGDWNLASLQQGVADVEQIKSDLGRIKQAFADVPGVADAIGGLPDLSVADPTAAIQRAAWPGDKTTILAKKSDWDVARKRVDDLKAADYPGKAWSAVLAALHSIKFKKPPIQQRWDQALADSRVARFSSEALAAGLPELYQGLSKADLLPTPPDPNELAWATAKATRFGHAALNQNFTLVVQSLSSQPAAGAVAGATPVIDGFKQLDAAWPGDSPTPGNKPITDAYTQLLDQTAQTTIAGIVKNPSEARAAVADFQAQNTRLRSDATAVAAGIQAVADANAALKSTAVPVLGQWETLAANLSAAGPRSGFPDPGAAGPSAQVAAVVNALKTGDINQIAAYAQQGEPPVLLRAVAQRWPGALHGGDADTDARIFASLKKGLGQVPPETARAVAALWEQRMGEAGLDPGAADHLWALYVSLGIPAPRALAETYFNVQLAGLKSRMGGLSDAQRKDEIKSFVGKTAPLAALPAVKDIQQKLSDAVRPNSQTSAAPGAFPANFHAAADIAGDLLIFENSEYPVRFKHIPANGPVHSFYLSTTEVPVGLFIAMVNGPDKQAMMKKLMALDIPKRKVGPCAWIDDGAGWIRAKNSNDPWMSADYTGWAAALPTVAPSAHMPMQYVSPLAAMYAASLANCRLPTAAEWDSAYRTNLRDSGDDNDSDANWASLRNTIAGLKLTNPGEEKSLERSREELGVTQGFNGPVQKQAHEQLWYRPVISGVDLSGQMLHDMRGNVAEWVVDDAPAVKFDAGAGTIQITDKSGAIQSAQSQDDTALADFYKHCLRIGQTSTSDVQTPESAAEPATAELHANSTHHHEYFDVGFRMALDDPSSGGNSGPDLVALVNSLQPVGR